MKTASSYISDLEVIVKRRHGVRTKHSDREVLYGIWLCPGRALVVPRFFFFLAGEIENAFRYVVWDSAEAIPTKFKTSQLSRQLMTPELR